MLIAASGLVAADVGGPAAAAALPRDTVAVPAPIAGLGYKLVFDDNFTQFDPSVWDDHIWYEQAVPGTVFARNGVLHLQSRRSDNWRPANATTASGKTWLYGYFQVRMHWTGSPGAWPAFWLLAEAQRDGKTGARRLAGEVDIEEGDGTDPYGYNVAVHRNSGADFGVPDTTAPAGSWHADLGRGNLANHWHTYGLLWTPTTLTWYLDGRQVATAPTFGHSTDQPMFMILTMADGGARSDPGPPPASAPPILESDFDWVRVWQLPSGA